MEGCHPALCQIVYQKQRMTGEIGNKLNAKALTAEGGFCNYGHFAVPEDTTVSALAAPTH